MTSQEPIISRSDAAFNKAACDKQTPEMGKNGLGCFKLQIDALNSYLPFDKPVVPEEQTIAAVSFIPFTFAGLEFFRNIGTN